MDTNKFKELTSSLETAFQAAIQDVVRDDYVPISSSPTIVVPVDTFRAFLPEDISLETAARVREADFFYKNAMTAAIRSVINEPALHGEKLSQGTINFRAEMGCGDYMVLHTHRRDGKETIVSYPAHHSSSGYEYGVDWDIEYSLGQIKLGLNRGRHPFEDFDSLTSKPEEDLKVTTF